MSGGHIEGSPNVNGDENPVLSHGGHSCDFSINGRIVALISASFAPTRVPLTWVKRVTCGFLWNHVKTLRFHGSGQADKRQLKKKNTKNTEPSQKTHFRRDTIGSNITSDLREARSYVPSAALRLVVTADDARSPFPANTVSRCNWARAGHSGRGRDPPLASTSIARVDESRLDKALISVWRWMSVVSFCLRFATVVRSNL